MAGLRFACNAVETFDLFALKSWAGAELERAGRARDKSVTVEVLHPDREMDGSCRWCGCRDDELVKVDL